MQLGYLEPLSVPLPYGVLLSEDGPRELRLSGLEPQYYRAVVDNDWGASHLEGNLGTFWSGASCRDISMVLPYSRIMGHAANFAEQIAKAAEQELARISIWRRDSESGSIDKIDLPVCESYTYDRGLLKVVVDEGVVDVMRRLRAEMLPNETGGIVVGYFDFNVGTLFIVSALPPPPDSHHSPTSFIRGVEGLEERLKDVAQRTANIVGYVGEWHSHPDGHSADPSGTDVVQLTALATKMSEDGLSAIQIIVSADDVHITLGAVLN